MTVLTVLNSRFHPADFYSESRGDGYQLLPFRFLRLDATRQIITNLAGEFLVIPEDLLGDLIHHRLDPDSVLYNNLKSRHFLIDGDSNVALDLMAAKIRTKYSLLPELTSLFLFVVTLRCEHSCPYCQVSRQSTDRSRFDMCKSDAMAAVELMFQSPSKAIKVEFQGGEPLLNFDLIRQIVLQTTERNASEAKSVEFVIASNLALLTDEILDFCAKHEIQFSTSLDGPEALHNQNRPRPGNDSHAQAVSGIRRIRECLGDDPVAALMTTTEKSLECPRAIIDEYIQQGFDSIFLRCISPYGFAVKTGQARKYDSSKWLAFYRDALAYIIDINIAGTYFREEFAALLLRKMLTPFPTGYVDLQSPAGMGLSCLVFNYDGTIYASDEARMLAEMGDKTFALGRLGKVSLEDVITGDQLLDIIDATMCEGTPMCVDCAFQPYCGSDPVFHYATQGNPVGFKPTSEFCAKNMAVIRHLFLLLEDDSRARDVLMSWL